MWVCLNILCSWRCHHDMTHIFWNILGLRKVLVQFCVAGLFWGEDGWRKRRASGHPMVYNCSYCKALRCEITLASGSDSSALDYHAIGTRIDVQFVDSFFLLFLLFFPLLHLHHAHCHRWGIINKHFSAARESDSVWVCFRLQRLTKAISVKCTYWKK